MIPKTYVTFDKEPEKPFLGCSYLNIEEKKIFNFDGKAWNSTAVIGKFRFIVSMTPPTLYEITETGDIIKSKRRKMP